MKKTRWTARLLSVLMAFAIVCTLATPAGASSGMYGSYSAVAGDTVNITTAYNMTDYTWSCYDAPLNDFSYPSYYASATGNVNGATVSISPNTPNNTTIYVYAVPRYAGQVSWAGIVGPWVITVTNTGYGNNYVMMSAQTLSVGTSPAQLSVLPVDNNVIIQGVVWTSNDPTVAVPQYTSGNSTYIQGKKAGTAIITATVSGYYSDYYGRQFPFYNQQVTCAVTVSTTTGTLSINPSSVVLQPTSTVSSWQSTLLTVETTVADPAINLDNVVWTCAPANIVGLLPTSATGRNPVTGRSVSVYGITPGQTTVTATLTVGNQTYTATCQVTVGNTIAAEATVFTNETNFSMTSTNSKTALSVAEQIAQAINGNYFGWGGSSANVLEYVVFQNTTAACGSLSAVANTPYYYGYGYGYGYGSTGYYGDLSSVVFTPSSTGKAVFPFTAYDTNRNSYSGTLTINVEWGSTGIDVLYTPARGQSQTLNATDFSNFWRGKYSSGTLQYVSFGTPSSGSNVGGLYYYVSNRQQSVTSSANNRFYLTSTTGGYGIGDVSFIPARTTSSAPAGVLVVPFTAVGTTGAGSATATQYGSLYIVVTAGEVETITYSAEVTALNPTDFTNVYRTATGSAANTGMYIRFLDVPAYGDLYVDYTTTGASSYYNNIRLTASNIGSYSFTNTARTSASYSISDVTYVPSSTARSTESIRYAAYSSTGVLQYVGTIAFNNISLSVSYKAGIAGVTFRTVDFFGGNLLKDGQYVAFGTPSRGTLYRSYANGKGTPVTATTYFSNQAGLGVYAISDVTYVPAANFSGAVTIPFTVYTASSTAGSGTITIQVTNKTFSDVKSSDWAYAYIYRLVAEGVVQGNTATTFNSKGVVSNGEALKMILLAAGLGTPTEGTGNSWAQPYIDLAYQKGVISSKNVNAAEKITRERMALLACKALGISGASSVNAGIAGPTDISGENAEYQNAIRALYNAGILNGVNEGNVNKFKPTETLTREEMAKIVCAMIDYRDTHK